MKQYEMLELAFAGEVPQGSESQVDFTAVFKHKGNETKVRGFYAGDGIYKVRFLPLEAGTYSYELSGVINDTGLFIAEKAEPEPVSEGKQKLIDMGLIQAERTLHGPVTVKGTTLQYADGTNFFAFGTTVYALAHQEQTLIEETMETLKNSPFNKVRMCVFPKHYNYNHNEPDHFAFRKDDKGAWDTDHPDYAFWDHLESLIRRLDDMEIQVDLILFHPYDRWGLAYMGMESNLRYLDYAMRRLAAFPNVWWSLANEYDLFEDIKGKDWEVIGKYVQENDPYHHLISCHNCFSLYDHSREEITHASIQSRDLSRTASFIEKYQKPVIIDECCYEGNLLETFGSITAEEMVSRFWKAFVSGGHCTHGETYLDYAALQSPEDEDHAVVWWAKGGKLIGQSPERIAYLRKFMESLPGPLQAIKQRFVMIMDMTEEELEAASRKAPSRFASVMKEIHRMDPVEKAYHIMPEYEYAGRYGDEVFVYYYGQDIHGRVLLELPEEHTYKVEIIDTWNMTSEIIQEEAGGKTYVLMPSKQWMAVKATKI